MVKQCEEGAFVPERYRILQTFPGLVVSFAHVTHYLGDGYWYVVVLQIVPLAHDRSKVVSHSFRMPQRATGHAWRRAARALAWPSIDRLFGFFARRVQREGNIVCEHLQSHAALDDPPPRLALHKERIGWFDEAYALAVTGVRTGAFHWPER